MKVLICGGRDYNDWPNFRSMMRTDMTRVISGGARGADALAIKYALEQEIPVEIYPAQWKKYKMAAGPIRNTQMLIEGKPDLVMAFPGGKGTANMVMQAKQRNIPVEEIKIYGT